jgi:L-ascorbate metabolism protein UlaG (beta-lactamase superfamily)
MQDQNVYLKPNTVIEPLWDQWYAWSHLISPATAAMNLVGRHMKIIDSFIMSPKVHEHAVKNPKMRGGPFMDIDPVRVEEVKQLKENTQNKRAFQIKFTAAIKELDKLLKEEGKGYSLDDLYAKVPEMLKGYVELVYDLNNNPSYRIFEALLYKSDFYNEDSQSIALWLTNNDERPFVLSTPRLKGDKDVLHFSIPFKDQVIDLLGKMKRKAYPYNKVKELLGISQEDQALFKTFFTTEKPSSYQRYTGDKVRIRYFGHACILVETKDVTILLDPVISYYGYQTTIDRFSDVDLPDVIDYVLITHNHQDHILFETLLPLRHKIKNIIVPATTSGALQDPNLKIMFNAIGFNQVQEINSFETIEFKDCVITGIPFMGEHSDLDIHSKVCHHVKVGEFSMLFAADSCNVEPKLYEHVNRLIGDIDVLFLGMECEGAPLSWLYGPLLSETLARDKDQSRRLAGSNCERGMALVEAINATEVYVYAMGQEPWLEYISSIKYTDESKPIVESNQLIEICTKQGRIAERLFGEKEILYSKYPVDEMN